MPATLHLAAVVLLSASMGAVPVLAQARPGPDALARTLQQRYSGIRDFAADFVQTYRGGVLRTETRERGTVVVKKPGFMRWVYLNPRKEFVSDGRTLYSYYPDDRQVTVSCIVPEDTGSTAALFLAGKGDITRDFTAAFADTTVAGTVALRLIPRRTDADYEHFVVTLDPGTLQIRAIATRDNQGGDSTLTFEKLKENRGISDKGFMFRIPRGVDVLNDGSHC
jgi:outer membrane lipoprotein carrier protein